jgi:hypothetical protein
MSIRPFNSTPFSLLISQTPHKIFLANQLDMTRIQNKNQFLTINLYPYNIINNPKTENSNRNFPKSKNSFSLETPLVNNFIHFVQNENIQQNHRKINNQLKLKRHKIFTILSPVKIVNLSWIISNRPVEDIHKFIIFYNEFKTGKRFVQNRSFGST